MKHSIFIILLVSWTFLLNDFYLIFIPQSQIMLLWILDIIFYTIIPVVVQFHHVMVA